MDGLPQRRPTCGGSAVNTRDYDAATRADLLLGADIWNRRDLWELHRGGTVRFFNSYNALLVYLDAVEDRRDSRASRCVRLSPGAAARRAAKP